MAKRILIIEDEMDLSNTLLALLQSYGFEALRAFDGTSGLVKAKMNKPDLIILDLKMPVMDGVKLAKMLKSDRNTKDIPIIVVSDVAKDDLQLMVSEIGAADYITKPFAVEELIKKIKELIEPRRFL